MTEKKKWPNNRACKSDFSLGTPVFLHLFCVNNKIDLKRNILFYLCYASGHC